MNSDSPRWESLADLLPHAAASGGPTSGIIDLDGELTPWAAIDDMTIRLGASLQALGVQHGDRVAVLHPKSLASFCAMHAIVRAGGIAVPLDPFGAGPAVAAAFRQADTTAMIGAAGTVQRLLGTTLVSDATQLILSGAPDGLIELGVAQDRVIPWDAALATTDTIAGSPTIQDPAYIIFTSGSTGTPKGIVHTHRSALAYAGAAVRYHRLDPTSRLAGFAPLHFDMSTLELWAVPAAGATAVTFSEAEQRFPATMTSRLARDRVTHLYAVVFQLRQMLDRGAMDDRDLSSVAHVGFAGEQFAPGALAALMAALPEANFTNVYGPAEVNAVTTFDMPAAPASATDIPIGTAWPGVELKIVSDDGSEVAHGEIGDLWISAPTCMEGYWREPERTASQLTDRDAAPPWYASGDIVYCDDFENYYFVGRRDHQVKVRGVRLELEPIEAVLEDAPNVAHAVVGPFEGADGSTQLIAWLVANQHCDIDTSEVRSWCARQLPGTAVPTAFVVRDTFPTTRSGKIDRTAVRKELQPGPNN